MQHIKKVSYYSGADWKTKRYANGHLVGDGKYFLAGYLRDPHKSEREIEQRDKVKLFLYNTQIFHIEDWEKEIAPHADTIAPYHMKIPTKILDKEPNHYLGSSESLFG